MGKNEQERDHNYRAWRRQAVADHYTAEHPVILARELGRRR